MSLVEKAISSVRLITRPLLQNLHVVVGSSLLALCRDPDSFPGRATLRDVIWRLCELLHIQPLRLALSVNELTHEAKKARYDPNRRVQ
jgi:hypothetical protein